MTKQIIKVDDKEVNVLEKQLTPIIAKAIKVVVIRDDKELSVATEVLSQLNQYADSVKAKKKELTDPANATIKAIKALFLPLEEKVLPKIEAIREAMSVYQTEKTRLAQEKEAEIANRVGEGKGKLRVETAIKKIGEIDKPLEKIATESGGLRFRATPRLKVTDITKIPREYLVVDESKTLEALKNGIEVSGAEIEIIQVPINSR